MTLASKTLVALAISSAVAFAQANRDHSEERFRAKFGRSTPAVEKRQAENQANTAYRDATPARTAGPSDAELRHRAKFGRATPAEESKMDAEKANTAYRDVTTPPEDRWYDNYMRTKHGRSGAKK